MFHGWAGAWWADWLFMLGLAGIAIALLTGVALRITAIAGTIIGLALVAAGNVWGFGKAWAKLGFVARHPWLR